MRSQEFYEAMTEAFQSVDNSPPKFTEFVISQTSMDKIVGEETGSPKYTIISANHLRSISWITLPKALYSTAEGSYSMLYSE